MQVLCKVYITLPALDTQWALSELDVMYTIFVATRLRVMWQHSQFSLHHWMLINKIMIGNEMAN